MKKVYLILAAAVGMTITSCTTNDYLGDVNNDQAINDGSIQFGLKMQNMTRADIAGQEAAKLLGNHFYVTGTKGTEAATSPSPTLVFDNYLVEYGINTAGTTESNTANWEYVGITPDGTNYAKLSSLNSQTIKYWDYSAPQYDFLAFSTGNHKALVTTTPSAGTIGVTAMNYGTSLASSGVAYSFYLPDETALAQAYITDIKEVKVGDYGKEVQLTFKSLSSKVRVALYETVPGYSVKDVTFYTEDGTTDFDDDKGTDAALISATGIPTKGQIDVIFPHVGDNNDSKEDYDKASATVTGSSPATFKTFGALTAQLVADEADEAIQGNYYLGRTLPTATFAGNANNKFYLNVFPVSDPAPLTLRVDYTLVPTDGAAETIVVKGAKAIVPSTYTKWLPNYAYTYIFKISDNTNGWTGAADKPSGLFPITFDAVVTEATDAMAEQTTITTVAAPTITTYQQNHNPNKDGKWITTDEYSIATGKNIYVQVMDNDLATPALVGTSTSKLPLLNAKKDSEDPKYQASLLYAVTRDPSAKAEISEATVMDALENRNADVADYNTNVKGRNGIILTYDDNINSAVTSIANGVDDNEITVSAGNAAEIDITGLSSGTYAYVYDYTWKSATTAWTTLTDYTAKTNTTIYQPIAVTVNDPIGVDGQKFSSVTTGTLDLIDTSVAANVTADDEDVDDDYIYFTKTKNGTSSWTYSFVSVDGKKKLPAGLVKCPVTSLTANVNGTTTAVANTLYFTTYVRNTGKYAVKIIKVEP